MHSEQTAHTAWPGSERSFSARVAVESGASVGLGTARAGEHWRWAPTTQTPLSRNDAAISATPREIRQKATAASTLRIPETILRTMREASWNAGRSESEIWAEAAREWLMRRARDDEPQPPTPASGALSVPRTSHAWRAIDALLTELRASPNRDSVVNATAA